MKKLSAISYFCLFNLSALFAVNFTYLSAEATDYVQYVNPIIGTDSTGNFSHGNKDPFVATPFPMVLLTPDMTTDSQLNWLYSYNKCIKAGNDNCTKEEATTHNPLTGFRLSHQPSPWIGDYGEIDLMPLPINFDLSTTPTKNAIANSQYGVFSHKDETSKPYFYSVTFSPKNKSGSAIKTEMTATRRSGYLNFIYHDTTGGVLVIDLNGSDNGNGVNGNSLNYLSKSNKINIWTNRNSGGVPNDFKSFFTLNFINSEADTPIVPTAIKVWNNGELVSDCDQLGCKITGDHLIIALKFNVNKVSALIGSSFISQKQADFNLENELGTYTGKDEWKPKSFETVMAENKSLWDQYLGHIQLSSADIKNHPTSTIAYYTALYRTLLSPHSWYECTKYAVKGGDCDLSKNSQNEYQYIMHKSPYYTPESNKAEPAGCTNGICHGYLFTDEGAWDVYRTSYPFFALAYPDTENRLIAGWLNAYREGGWLPKWPSPGYRASMTGTHMDCIIADAYMRGVRNYDAQTALAAITKDATVDPDTDSTCQHGQLCGREGLTDYLEKGYVASPAFISSNDQGVSNTLDYAYDDYCIANMANAMGETTTADKFYAQSVKARESLFDTSEEYSIALNNSTDFAVKGIFRGKDSKGNWSKWSSWYIPSGDTECDSKNDYCLNIWGGPYTEGGAWQYIFYVPYDTSWLAEALSGVNGKEKTDVTSLENYLDAFFAGSASYVSGTYGRIIHEMREMLYVGLGQYEFSDQPVWGYVYEYNHTHSPWKTQCIVRNMMDPNRDRCNTAYKCFPIKHGKRYYPATTLTTKQIPPSIERKLKSSVTPITNMNLFSNGADGLLGDEDTGSMSAWFLTSALGLHPVPGTKNIEIGSPLFSNVTLYPYGNDQEKSIMITAKNNSEKNIFVARLNINGKVVIGKNNKTYTITQGTILNKKNNTLTFWMRAKP